MKRLSAILGILIFAGAWAIAPDLIPRASGSAAEVRVPYPQYSLFSPDKKIEVAISSGFALLYWVKYEGRMLVAPSAVSLTVEAEGTRVLGRDMKVRKQRRRTVDEILTPVVKQKSASVRDRFNELTLESAGGYALIFRAYDDGIAYRFATEFKKPVTVVSERAEFAFPGDRKIWFGEEESFQTHSERFYKSLLLSEVTDKRFACCPVVVDNAGGPKVAVTEADLEDYPGMYLTGIADSPATLAGKFPAYPLREEAKNDRDVPVVERAPFLVKTSGTRVFPWRVLMIAPRDGALIENTLVYRLAKPATGDFSWVKPGKVAWDWWNDWNLAGVDFRAGVNTETYKYYIDFAAHNGIEYIILDEGWYQIGDLLSVSPGMDVPQIVAYGKSKGVGIILWAIWKTLDDQLDPAMTQFAKWGVAGLKVDFMQRDDAWMVNYYYRIAAEAAKQHFLVDFHGAYKPTGLYRTFPNVLTSEGVMGLEHSKWSRNITPEHDVTLPFTRMAAGPMDFTPGAMLNGGLKGFEPIYRRPMSQGTRCHQLAMYVVYESPLQMLADSPTNYLREPECLEFLAGVPTVWDETRVLEAEVGDYVMVARRSGAKWFVGAMTDETARNPILDLSFLGEGTFEMTLYRDGRNADRNGNDYKMFKQTVTRADRIDLPLAPGGGAAAVISPAVR
ncbi:MAG: glycoside hydrolase family 97 protein [Candidatus Aminicenantales bacterium]